MSDDEAVLLAEQATLGALVLDPGHLPEVAAWLRSADFTDPWHAQVFMTMLERHRGGASVELPDLARALVERLGARRADVVRLADLLHVTPRRPAAATYARMVAESGLRREVAGQGVLLKAGALQSALTCESVPVASTCALVDAGLDAAARRWALATGAPDPGPETPLALRPALRNRELRVGADKILGAHPGRDPLAERRHVIELIGALIAHPESIPPVASWLSPTRIAAPQWRTVYAAAVELAERGQAVDVVTVAWEARRLAHHGVEPPGLRELRQAVDDGWLTLPRAAAHVVAGDQLRHLAEAGAHQLLTGAENPALIIDELVDTGHLVTAALRHISSGLPERGDTTEHPRLALVRTPDVARGPVTR
jgi:hypothetical protein